jgi:hypothetical protein
MRETVTRETSKPSLEFTINDQKRIITFAGSLEQTTKLVKAIFRSIYPSSTVEASDATVDDLLREEMPTMQEFERREINVAKVRSKISDLPQLTFGIHRLKFTMDLENNPSRPRIVVKYYANEEYPREDFFPQVKEVFEKALENIH